MSLEGELKEWFEFEGGIVGDGKLSDRGVDIQTNENLEKDQIDAMHMELNKLEHQIADTFEKKDELMRYITLQAKLRLLIQKRLKGVKKIPQEYVDKYNEIVTGIRDILTEQAEKESGSGEE